MKNNKVFLLMAIYGFAFNMYASDTKYASAGKATDTKEKYGQQLEIKTHDNKIIKIFIDKRGNLEIQKYLSDGALDNSFGVRGSNHFSVPLEIKYVTNLIETPNGRIIIDGIAENDRKFHVDLNSLGVVDFLGKFDYE